MNLTFLWLVEFLGSVVIQIQDEDEDEDGDEDEDYWQLILFHYYICISLFV